jgi:enoyl-CoA hydratase/carnithine racemase
MPTADSYAKKIIEKSGVAVRLCMDSILEGLEMSKNEALSNDANALGLAAATNALGLAAATADSMEGVLAFLEKRKPVFQNK